LTPTLTLTGDHDSAIRAHALRDYPHECCGLLLGRDEPGRRVVTRVREAENTFEQGQRTRRFAITGELLLSAEKQAGSEGLLVLGFYHSHPDHPARPSEFDREHAWPFYSYVIVNASASGTGPLTSWLFEEAATEFLEQPVEIVAGGDCG
jgi:proteasome lid subunit RPN8/RPN11